MEQHSNELRSLQYLCKGLNHLNAQVVEIENRIRHALPKDQAVFLYGNAPQLNGVPQDLIACFFHWYSVTVCNYVRLAGWLGNGPGTERAKNYLTNVLPEVSLCWDKVGAHFARVNPRQRGPKADSEADLNQSQGEMRI